MKGRKRNGANIQMMKVILSEINPGPVDDDGKKFEVKA
jgi:hypothetical protein